MDMFIESVDSFTDIVGSSWINKHRAFVGREFAKWPLSYKQLGVDLGVLAWHVDKNWLIHCYQDMLRSEDTIQLLQARHEIHDVSLLGRIATEMRLHVPRGDGSNHNFDAQAIIAEQIINADVKTHMDDFLLNMPVVDTQDGIKVRGGWRPTADHHEVENYKLRSTPAVDLPVSNSPEAKIIRDKLLKTLNKQLPISGINLILLGHLAGDRAELDSALEGAPVWKIIRNHATKEWWSEWDRLPTGAFTGSNESDAFRPLSGVLWFRLAELDGKLVRAYRLYAHDHRVANSPIPHATIERLRGVLEKLQTVTYRVKTEPIIYRVPANV